MSRTSAARTEGLGEAGLRSRLFPFGLLYGHAKRLERGYYRGRQGKQLGGLCGLAAVIRPRAAHAR